MSKFEDNLWAQLERDHAPVLHENVARKRRTNTSRWLAAAAVAAMLGTAAAIAPAYFGGTPPAYAVIDNRDGTVTLKVREIEQVDEATAKMREMGIPVAAVPLRENCQMRGRKINPPGDPMFDVLKFQSVDNEFAITITLARIPANGTVVFAAGKWFEMPIIRGGMYASDDLPDCFSK
ncbi:hypothetical protein [Lentzea sp. NPDC051838]|uniref:hypothetical protein n=1 Tax=Lentzea sp. NPDC051838 TaxID=3154849 RepID=UPI003429F394